MLVFSGYVSMPVILGFISVHIFIFKNRLIKIYPLKIVHVSLFCDNF